MRYVGVKSMKECFLTNCGRSSCRVENAARSAPLYFSIVVTIALLLVSTLTVAHNNPTFREDLLGTIVVDPAATPNSSDFTITWSDKKTVQLIWKIVDADDNDASATLTLSQQGDVVAEITGPEATTDRFEGEGFSLTVANAKAPFSVELYGKVLDRNQKESN